MLQKRARATTSLHQLKELLVDCKSIHSIYKIDRPLYISLNNVKSKQCSCCPYSETPFSSNCDINDKINNNATVRGIKILSLIPFKTARRSIHVLSVECTKLNSIDPIECFSIKSLLCHAYLIALHASLMSYLFSNGFSTGHT